MPVGFGLGSLSGLFWKDMSYYLTFWIGHAISAASYTSRASGKHSSSSSRSRIARPRSPGVPNGMGAVLFCRGGRLQFLEVFAYGDDHWAGVYDGFAIEETD